MKYNPKKVFIKENGLNIEITYEEHVYRKYTDVEYQKKWFIPVQGCIMETDREHYVEFYRVLERINYLEKLDIEYRLSSIDYYDDEDMNAKMFLEDPNSSIEEQLERKIEIEELYRALQMLTKEEKELIEGYFFDEISQVELAKRYNKNQSNISRKIARILVKIKKILKN